ncbi:hypothetical protein [Thermosulfuriphilus ammonigenes]|uniref:hypothetical protein n=1 Tax=Thermosulfuriphilus ammonigenes TaxID=1936021 RepID=UPI001AF01889|nr:hypothetical protein [Thermosulfuriphilus ammonigenes]
MGILVRFRTSVVTAIGSGLVLAFAILRATFTASSLWQLSQTKWPSGQKMWANTAWLQSVQ